MELRLLLKRIFMLFGTEIHFVQSTEGERKREIGIDLKKNQRNIHGNWGSYNIPKHQH